MRIHLARRFNMRCRMQACSSAFAAIQPDIVILLGIGTKFCCHRMSSTRNTYCTHVRRNCTTSAIDECVRHAVTKLSHLHFPVSADLQPTCSSLGSSLIGCTQSDLPALKIARNEPMSRRSVEEEINFHFHHWEISL